MDDIILTGAENKIDKQSSNSAQGWVSICTNTLEKDMNSVLLPARDK